MALISAGEWIDRYAADAQRRAAGGDADANEQCLSFHIEVEQRESRARSEQRARPVPQVWTALRLNAWRPQRLVRRLNAWRPQRLARRRC